MLRAKSRSIVPRSSMALILSSSLRHLGMDGRPVGPKCLLIRAVAVAAAARADPPLEVLVLAVIRGVGAALSEVHAAPSGLLFRRG